MEPRLLTPFAVFGALVLVSRFSSAAASSVEGVAADNSCYSAQAQWKGEKIDPLIASLAKHMDQAAQCRNAYNNFVENAPAGDKADGGESRMSLSDRRVGMGELTSAMDHLAGAFADAHTLEAYLELHQTKNGDLISAADLDFLKVFQGSKDEWDSSCHKALSNFEGTLSANIGSATGTGLQATLMSNYKHAKFFYDMICEKKASDAPAGDPNAEDKKVCAGRLRKLNWNSMNSSLVPGPNGAYQEPASDDATCTLTNHQ